MRFLYRGSVYEMAMPTEEHKGYKLYHGTDEKHAKEILQTGMLKGHYYAYEASPDVLEEVKVPVSEVWYHGSKHDFTKFNPQYSYVEGESNARFGPGFYLTQDINEALGYAGHGGFLKEVVIKNLKKIKQADGKVSGPLALKAVNSIPEDRKDSVLSNWAPSEVQAKREIYLSIVQNSQNFGDQAQTIWYECFRYCEPDFCRFMAKNLDGIVYPRDGYPCIVGYNAEALQIVKNTPAGPLMDELEAKSGSSS